MSPLATLAVIAWAAGVALVLVLLAAAERVSNWGGQGGLEGPADRPTRAGSAPAAVRE